MYSLQFLLSFHSYDKISRRARRVLFRLHLWKPARKQSHYIIQQASKISHLVQAATVSIAAIDLCIVTIRLFVQAVAAIQVCYSLLCLNVYLSLPVLRIYNTSNCVHGVPPSTNSASTYVKRSSSNNSHTSKRVQQSIHPHLQLITNSGFPPALHSVIPNSHSIGDNDNAALSIGAQIHTSPSLKTVCNTKALSTSVIRAALVNARSLSNKSTIMNAFIDTNHLDLVAITESWLTGNDVVDNQILNDASPNGYNFFNVPRSHKRGGGIALIFRKALQIKSIPDFHLSNAFESAVFQVSNSSQMLTIVVIYRPPNMSRPAFENDFSFLISKLLGVSNFVICGDFNLSVSTLSSDETHDDLFFKSLNLKQHVNHQTHVNGNILDLILSLPDSSFITSVEVRDGISDHDSVFFTLQLFNSASVTPQFVTSRAYHKINEATFEEDILAKLSFPIFSHVISFLSQQNSSDSDHQGDCDYLFHLYDSILVDIVNDNAPAQIQRKSQKTCPWWSSQLRKLRCELRRAEKKWRTHKSTIHLDIFRACKSRYHEALKGVKARWLRNNIRKCADSPKRLWSLLNTAVGRKLTPSLPHCSSHEELALKFNLFFIDKVDGLRNTLNSLSPPTIREHQNSSNLSIFSNFSEKLLEKIIMSSPTKSDIVDPLPSWLLKRYLRVLLPVLTSLINFSLSTAMPSDYKHALVRPLIKKRNADPDILSNYRPVSCLPFVSKLIERCVATRITDHLEAGGHFDPYQSAYRGYHSCETAITYVLDNVYSATDRREVTFLILLDLTAAFDTVDHAILISKLESVGIVGHALHWIKTYLSGRSQSVVIGDSISSPLPILSGVPQGSVLGPLLFTIYLLGIGEIFNKYSIKFVIYADDIQLIVSTSVSDMDSAIHRINSCLSEVKKWLLSHKLVLNEKKTEVILLGNRQILSRLKLSNILINGVNFPLASSVRDLGVTIDKHLTFKNQVAKVCSNMFFHLRVIARVRKSLTLNQCLLLIQSLVSSRFLFCCTIYNNLPECSLQKFQRVLNSSMRVAVRKRKSQSVSEDFTQHGWLSIEKMLLYHTASFIFNILSSGKPVYLNSWLQERTSLSSLRSSSQSLLGVHTSNTNIGSRAFRCYGPKLWNSIPSTIKDCRTRQAFQLQLRQHLCI
jgi:exonuclease III